MKIETKFNPGDKVWVIHDGKAVQLYLRSVKIDADDSSDNVQIQNFVNIGTETNYQCKIFEEKYCFSTREELIKSLE